MSDVPLPQEVLVSILLRLPVKSLLRFRSVSKSLCALIDSPFFVNLHLQKSLKIEKIISFCRDVSSSTSIRSLKLDSHTAVKLETPFNRTRFPDVLGSCHGLICLCSDPFDRLLLLWNPSTRKYKLIPNPRDYPPRYAVTTAVDQLGYDHVNDDYKVVRVTQSYASRVWLDSKFFVYSLKLNSWLEHKFPYNLLLVYCRGQGVCVSGALHWLVNQITYPTKNNLIVSYDLASQIFQLVPQPEYSDDYVSIDLGVLGGCLCVVCKHETYSVDIWVMGEYGVKESWSKLVTFTIRNDMTSDFLSVRPIIYLKNGKELLLEINQQWLEIYDLEEKKSKPLLFRDVSHMSTFVYHESLV